MHWSRPAGHGGAEGSGHEFGDPAAVVDHPGALGDRSGHGYLIDLLEGGHSFLRKLSGAGHEDHRAFRSEDGRKTRDGVGVTRSAGEHGHGWLSGDPGVGVGHMHRRTFVAGVDELDTFVSGGVYQGQDGVAYYSKDLLNAFLL